MKFNSYTQKIILAYLYNYKSYTAFKYLKPEFFIDPDVNSLCTHIQHFLTKYSEIVDVDYILSYAEDGEYDTWEDILTYPVKYSEKERWFDLASKFIQQKSLVHILQKQGGKSQEVDIVKIYTSLGSIVSLDLNEDNSAISGEYIERSDISVKLIHGNPTYIPELNNLTKAGGFYSPQLIIFLGGPKSFKTGFLLNLAVNHALDGLKVLYADFENGKEELTTRLQQCMCQCSEEDLQTDKNRRIFRDVSREIEEAGGSVHLKCFYGRKDSINKVDHYIGDLIAKDEWKPDVIIYDYMDIIGESTDRRLGSQYNYIYAININKKYSTFSYSISKVTRDAIEKGDIKAMHIAEDTEKLYNAHAIFALNVDSEDRQSNRMRITSIYQRRGKSQTRDQCWLNINFDTETITPFDYDS